MERDRGLSSKVSGETKDTRSLSPKSRSFSKYTMTIDLEKATQALATLLAEKQAQQDRLKLAAEAKQRIDETNAQRTLANRNRML